jgi:hypothetical protein
MSMPAWAKTSLLAALGGALAGAAFALAVEPPYVATASLQVGSSGLREPIEPPLDAARRLAGLGVAAAARSPGGAFEATLSGAPSIAIRASARTASSASAILEAATGPVLALHKAWHDQDLEIIERHREFFAGEAAEIEARLDLVPADASSLISPLYLSRADLNALAALRTPLLLPGTQLLRPLTARTRKPLAHFAALGGVIGLLLGLLLSVWRKATPLARGASSSSSSSSSSSEGGLAFVLRSRRILAGGALAVGLAGLVASLLGGPRYNGRIEVQSAEVAPDGPVAPPETAVLRLQERLDAEVARGSAGETTHVEAAWSSAADSAGTSDIIELTAAGPDPELIRALLQLGARTLADAEDPLFETERRRIEGHVFDLRRDLSRIQDRPLSWEARMTRLALVRELAHSERHLSPARTHATAVLYGPRVEPESAAQRAAAWAGIGLLVGLAAAAVAAFVFEAGSGSTAVAPRPLADAR